MILGERSLLFSTDGRRMIVLHDGPYPACYVQERFEFNVNGHRCYGLWSTPGKASDRAQALLFLAGEEIELLT